MLTCLTRELVIMPLQSKSSKNKPFSAGSVSFPSIEFRIIFIICFFIFIFISHSAQAKKDGGHSIYIMNEQNGHDYIRGFGVSSLHKYRSNDIGVGIDMSLSKAEIYTGKHSSQEYIAWELGGKVGYFSDIFFYGEFGFDFGELVFQDRDEEVYDVHYCDNEALLCNNFNYSYSRDGYDDSNDIDIYLGLGGGIDFGPVKLTAYSRYRQVDGEYWTSEGRFFSGVKLALSF